MSLIASHLHRKYTWHFHIKCIYPTTKVSQYWYLEEEKKMVYMIVQIYNNDIYNNKNIIY